MTYSAHTGRVHFPGAVALAVFFLSAVLVLGTGCDNLSSDTGVNGTGDPVNRTPGEFESPVRIAWAGTDRAYVSDFLGRVVFDVSFSEGVVRSQRAIEVDGAPVGVAWWNNVLYIGNSDSGTIERYDTGSGRYLSPLGAAGQFQDPVDIAVDSTTGFVYVLDGREKTISVFDSSLMTQVRTISGPGMSDDALQNPTSVVVDAKRGVLIVGDYGTVDGSGQSPAIKLFDFEGTWISSISGKLGMLGQRFSRIQGMSMDAAGRVLVTDALSGEVLVVDLDSEQIVESYGSFGSEIGQLWLPLDVAVSPTGTVYVTNNRMGRIEVFSSPTAKGYLVSHAASNVDTDVVVAGKLNPNHSCSFCHNIHGGSSTQLLVNSTVEALCLTCHGPGGPSTLKVDNHVYKNSTCADCHVAHSNVTNWLGGTNLKLVRDTVFAEGVFRPAVFESRGTTVGDPKLHSFCDGDQDGNNIWDAVCDTCHSGVEKHNYDEPNTHGHNQGKTCTTCHRHSNRFKKK